jgi:hypothetical protein
VRTRVNWTHSLELEDLGIVAGVIVFKGVIFYQRPNSLLLLMEPVLFTIFVADFGVESFFLPFLAVYNNTDWGVVFLFNVADQFFLLGGGVRTKIGTCS